MVEFLADGQRAGAVVRAWDDPVSPELAAEDLDLGFEEADEDVPTRGASFNEEVQSQVQPAAHGLSILSENGCKYSNQNPLTFWIPRQAGQPSTRLHHGAEAATVQAQDHVLVLDATVNTLSNSPRT